MTEFESLEDLLGKLDKVKSELAELKQMAIDAPNGIKAYDDVIIEHTQMVQQILTKISRYHNV